MEINETRCEYMRATVNKNDFRCSFLLFFSFDSFIYSLISKPNGKKERNE